MGNPPLLLVSGPQGGFALGQLPANCYRLQLYRRGTVAEDERDAVERIFCLPLPLVARELVLPVLADVALSRRWSLLATLTWSAPDTDLDLQVWSTGCSVGYYQRECGGVVLNRDSRDSDPLVALESIAVPDFAPDRWYHFFVTTNDGPLAVSGATVDILAQGPENHLNIPTGPNVVGDGYWSVLCVRLTGPRLDVVPVNRILSVNVNPRDGCAGLQVSGGAEEKERKDD